MQFMSSKTKLAGTVYSVRVLLDSIWTEIYAVKAWFNCFSTAQIALQTSKLCFLDAFHCCV